MDFYCKLLIQGNGLLYQEDYDKNIMEPIIDLSPWVS